MTILFRTNTSSFAVAFLLAAATATGTAHAATETATAFNYSTPKTGYFTVDPMAMAPNGDGVQYNLVFNSGLRMTADSSRCFSAGVNLPQGATITQVAVYYTSDAGKSFNFRLRRKTLIAGATTDDVAAKTVLGVSNAFLVTTAPVNTSVALINNAAYSYGFGICLTSASNSFYGARIMYTYINAGD